MGKFYLTQFIWKNHKKSSILKIRRPEFGLIKVLPYSSKSQNFCGIIQRRRWVRN